MISTKEIMEALDDALDKLQGDFTEKQLFDALKRTELYPFVCDKKKSVPKYLAAKRKFLKNG